MFKSDSKLEKNMRRNLISIYENNGKLRLNTNDNDVAFSLHECIEKGYLDNIDDWKDACGNYHFNIYGEIRVKKDGLVFIKEKSIEYLLLKHVGNLLKNIIVCLLGIVSGLLIEYYKYLLGF